MAASNQRKAIPAMLDPVVAFFTRLFQSIGRGIGLAVSFLLAPFRWFGGWFVRRGGIVKAVLGALLLAVLALYLYFFWNTQVWTGFNPDYAERYRAPAEPAASADKNGPSGIVSSAEQAGGAGAAATGGAAPPQTCRRSLIVGATADLVDFN